MTLNPAASSALPVQLSLRDRHAMDFGWRCPRARTTHGTGWCWKERRWNRTNLSSSIGVNDERGQTVNLNTSSSRFEITGQNAPVPRSRRTPSAAGRTLSAAGPIPHTDLRLALWPKGAFSKWLPSLLRCNASVLSSVRSVLNGQTLSPSPTEKEQFGQRQDRREETCPAILVRVSATLRQALLPFVRPVAIRPERKCREDR